MKRTKSLESEENVEDKNISKDDYDHNEYYDWELVPTVYPEDMKTGVTFKGDSEEYLNAHTKLMKLMSNKKGTTYIINGRKLKICIF